MKKEALQILTEPNECGERIGRDPRTVSAEEYEKSGIASAPIMSVIRAKCLDCCSNDRSEVRKCTAVSCALWPYRMGSNPFRSRELSDEQRAEIAERFRKARAEKF